MLSMYNLDEYQELIQDAGVYTVDFDQCMFGALNRNRTTVVPH